MNRLAFHTVRAALFWKPIRRHEQMLFAEALSQALSAGMEISTAVIVALEANPSYRFRLALREMAKHCRSGYTLERALTKTGVGVGGQLLAALRIGEENGKLAEMLASYARACCMNPAAKLAETVRRPAKVTQFALVLAELLKERHLTPALIEDAGLVAGGVGSRFAQEVADIANDMRNGSPIGYAFQYSHGSSFDSFFGKLIEATESRAQLRTVLISMSS